MTKIIAEIGCNHMGDMTIARKMVSVIAHFCEAHVVKFQKRNNRELLTPEQYNAPHPVPENAFGPSYGQHREALEFSVEQHLELKGHCEREGLVYSCSVWDLASAREIAELNPQFIKVPSASNLHFAMLDHLCSHYAGKIHISLGMTTNDEMESIVSYMEQRGRACDTVLYACTSGYPVKAEDVCLLEIAALRERFIRRVGGFGFSGHHLGIALDVAAATLGADWIERHFTLDRTWKGTDHAASLEPDGLRRLCRDVDAVGKALVRKREELLPVETVQRRKLKWVPSDV